MLEVFLGNHAVISPGFARTSSFGPIVVMAIWSFAVCNGVYARLADVLGVFADHRHKGVATITHIFAYPQSGNQIRSLLCVDLIAGIGTVNLEHVSAFRFPIIVVVRRKHFGIELTERPEGVGRYA